MHGSILSSDEKLMRMKMYEQIVEKSCTQLGSSLICCVTHKQVLSPLIGQRHHCSSETYFSDKNTTLYIKHYIANEDLGLLPTNSTNKICFHCTHLHSNCACRLPNKSINQRKRYSKTCIPTWTQTTNKQTNQKNRMNKTIKKHSKKKQRNKNRCCCHHLLWCLTMIF